MRHLFHADGRKELVLPVEKDGEEAFHTEENRTVREFREAIMIEPVVDEIEQKLLNEIKRCKQKALYLVERDHYKGAVLSNPKLAQKAKLIYSQLAEPYIKSLAEYRIMKPTSSFVIDKSLINDFYEGEKND